MAIDEKQAAPVVSGPQSDRACSGPPALKIAMVCSTLNTLGGPAVHISHLYRYVHSDQFRLTLIFCSAREDRLREFMISRGVAPADMVFIPHARKRTLYPLVKALRDLFRAEQFDIVHAFETQTQVLAMLAALWAGRGTVIAQCEAQFLPSTISRPKRMLYRTLNALVREQFARSITVSHGLARELVAEGFRPARSVEVVPLGIEPLHHGDPGELSYPGFAEQAPVIGAIARFSREKGLDRLLKAAARLAQDIPAVRFVIYGDGDEQAALRILARELRIEHRVQFRPWTSDVAAALRSYDIHVVPSRREGLSISLLEAMSMGRPAVASDIEGLRDVIDHGVDGILVDTADTEAFARALAALCRDPRKVIEMGARAVAKVRARFHAGRESAQMRAIYREVSGRSETASDVPE